MKRADHKDTQGKGIPGSRDTTQRPGGGTNQEVRDEREESSAEAQWARRMGGEGGQDQVTQAVSSQARVQAPQASAMLS